MWWQRSAFANNKVGQHLAGRQAQNGARVSGLHFVLSSDDAERSSVPPLSVPRTSGIPRLVITIHYKWADGLQLYCRHTKSAARQHAQCCAGGREGKIKFFRTLWSGITFHFRSKVGALVSRGVISLPHIFPKSAASVRQAKVWKWWRRRASRCTAIGDQCSRKLQGLKGTWPDSLSELLSTTHRLWPSARVTHRANVCATRNMALLVFLFTGFLLCGTLCIENVFLKIRSILFYFFSQTPGQAVTFLWAFHRTSVKEILFGLSSLLKPMSHCFPTRHSVLVDETRGFRYPTDFNL